MSKPAYTQIPTTDTHSGFFTHLYKDPDSNSGAQLYQRRYQWRPISWNPFDLGDQNEKPRDEEEHNLLESTTSLGPQDDPAISGIVTFQAEPKPLLNPGPSWVNLFYDLAWTATFSSLTQNGQFDSTWDAASYAVLFVIVWWLWASQVLYDMNFYTNDWFHFAAMFLQLGVFGLLSAATRGFDVTVYISHSPGMSGELDPKPMEDITDPSRYNSEMTARVSLRIIVFSIAISRLILLIQYLRVFAYAYFTVRSRRGRIYHIPRRLRILLSGLTISTALFFIGWGITRTEFGTTTSGARFKYAFWGSGLIVEVLSYIRMPKVLRRWIIALIKKWSTKNDNDKGVDKPLSFTVLPPSNSIIKQPSPSTTALPIPLSNVTLRDRLEAITTIILGEGINGIAGTLYSIISAPGLEGPIVVNIISTGFIVYFLAYLYFEGPTSGHADPRDRTRRKMYWLLLHLPFLLCIVLLLQGVKNQFLLTSFLSTARRIASDLKNMDEELLEIWTQPEIRSNKKIAGRLVEYGISWSQEYDALVQNMTSRGALWTNSSMSLTNGQREELYIWRWRLSLRSLMRIHGIFMGHDATPAQTQSRIADYYHNVTAPKHDHYTSPDSFADMHYYQILGEVLASSLQSARYIMVFVGCIFILLGALEFARSMPRDRFQCGAVISRLLMGWAFLFLLLLNVGKYQSLWVNKGDEYEQAGVFLWVSSYWVLPTIALAFAIESLIETVLVWLSALRYRGPHQWRPISWNPFAVHDIDGPIKEDEEYEKLLGESLASPQEELLKYEVLPASPKIESNQLRNPGPTWVNLFYDLAWTATFSSLTQNGEFDTIWDTVSYTVFFVVVWWLWASQVLYSINFYTDDWFHLLFIFLQMGVFGLLAATTRGYDVTTYILRSPGLDPNVLESKNLEDIDDPSRYQAEETARTSIEVIAFSIAVSRVLARSNVAHKLAPPRFGHGSNWFGSKKSHNDELKALGNMETTQSRSISVPSPPPELPVPESDVTLSSRLEAITTIILGEGINSIAGTLYSIIAAPGLENPIVTNIFCSGFIVYFLAYLYFEGPSSGHTDIKDKARRKVYWLLLHLPFLLCIVLLLQGVKNQFLLTSFLSTSRKIARDLENVDERVLETWSPYLGSDHQLARDLVKYNISWSDEHKALVKLISKHSPQGNISAPLNNEQKEELYIWHWRLSLKTLVRIHGIFMGNNKMSNDLQDRINDYYDNTAAPRNDHYASSDALADMNYYQILEKVLEHSVSSARYIMVLAASIFILLGALELAHSKPRVWRYYQPIFDGIDILVTPSTQRGPASIFMGE
ncbi:low temperature requirement protein LtrA [Rhizoctonia solani]|uniref:Low temperature requirement protein LtrA n=1 Tax=Rhizoctonia solani TaxID=456999 RepID=A0A8H8NV29_9AGAM|nr:low temperature requirement protein LtrA [Rhizoctonia solani]QRW20611.1 low temperature requirement protein LtrA [Rhizoctonia solani]